MRARSPCNSISRRRTIPAARCASTTCSTTSNPYYSAGALQFWIKGNQGGEIAWVGLVDDEARDGKKTVVRLPLNDFGGITNEWRLVSVPLAKFGRKGVFWDAKKRVEVPLPFDWKSVAEFRIEIKKADNVAFRAWVDDIFVLRDVYEPVKEVPQEYWEDKEEMIAPPAPATDVKPVYTLFKDAMPEGGFPYVYGGKTAVKVQPGHRPIPACWPTTWTAGITAVTPSPWAPARSSTSSRAAKAAGAFPSGPRARRA